jgi:hypothetical protein
LTEPLDRAGGASLAWWPARTSAGRADISNGEFSRRQAVDERTETAAPVDGEIIDGKAGETTVIAATQLPNLQIEVVHGTLPDGSGERISIHLQATPSFEAFGRVLEATNPLTFWTQAMQLAFAPWTALLSGPALLPWTGVPLCGVSRSKGKPGGSSSGQG